MLSNPACIPLAHSPYLGHMGYPGEDKAFAAERLSTPGWAVQKPQLGARTKAAPSFQTLKQGEGKLPIVYWLAHGHCKAHCLVERDECKD